MYKIFSVDDHIVEPANLWRSRVSSKYRETAPHVIEEDGRQQWVYEDERSTTMGLNAVAGRPRDQWNMEPASFGDMIPGSYDPKARAKDFLSQGVLASIGFPQLPRFGGMLFNGFKDKQLADECVKAWNDYVLDEWCPAGPAGLFVPLIICQVWDPAMAAAEIRRCAEKGARTLAMVENPVYEGQPSFHHESHWDPIWDAVQECDMPVSMHLGSSGWLPVIDPSAPYSSIIGAREVPSMLSVINLLVSPICFKFPEIKIVISEGGISWIPAILNSADRQIDRHSGWAGRRELLPSEVFQRNFWGCQVEDPIGLRTVYPQIGAEKILSECDYPHADTTYPVTQEAFKGVFDGIPEDVIEMVSHGNAERLFQWKMADEALLDDPEVVAWRKALNKDASAGLKLEHRPMDGVVKVAYDGRCRDLVLLRGGITQKPCGEVVGEDGVCAAGHVTRSVATA